jgi:hypothetical protein
MSFCIHLHNWRTELWNRSCLGRKGWYQWEGEEVGKVNRRMNVVKYCVLIYVNGKMIPTETIPGMMGGG